MRYSLHFLSCWAHVRFIQPYHSLCVCFFGIALFSNYKLFTLRSFTVFVDLLNNDLLFAILCQQIDDFAILWTIRVNSKLINIKCWISVKLPKKTSSTKDQTRENSHKISNLMFFSFSEKKKMMLNRKQNRVFTNPFACPNVIFHWIQFWGIFHILFSWSHDIPLFYVCVVFRYFSNSSDL